MQKKKPCPFCGCASAHTEEGSTFRWVVAVCDDCGARAEEVRKDTMSINKEEAQQLAEAAAFSAWNTRTAGA